MLQAWSRQQSSFLAILKPMPRTAQTAVPSLVLLLAICLCGISTPFMGCRLRTHTCNFPAKSLCLVLSEECPDQSDLGYNTFHNVFLVIPHPGCSSGFSHLASSSGFLYPSFILSLTSWWGWSSGTLGKGLGVDGPCRQRSLSAWQRCCGNQRESS